MDVLTTTKETVDQVKLDTAQETEVGDDLEASGENLVVAGEETAEAGVDVLDELNLRLSSASV